MSKKDFEERIKAAENAIKRKYHLEGLEDIEGYRATLTLGVSVQGGSRYLSHSLPVEVPAFMGLEEVLEVFVKTVSVWDKDKEAEAYLPKNEIEKIYMNAFWGKLGVKAV